MIGISSGHGRSTTRKRLARRYAGSTPAWVNAESYKSISISRLAMDELRDCYQKLTHEKCRLFSMLRQHEEHIESLVNKDLCDLSTEEMLRVAEFIMSIGTNGVGR